MKKMFFLKNQPDLPPPVKNKNLSPEEKNFLKEKLQSAIAFIKSVRQRGSTIKEIGNYILKHQHDFFKEGHLSLKPMDSKTWPPLSAVTNPRLPGHQSKIYRHPAGHVSLKYFFSQSVGNDVYGQGGVSNRQ
jgi:RNA polymerase sigma-54 factor